MSKSSPARNVLPLAALGSALAAVLLVLLPAKASAQLVLSPIIYPIPILCPTPTLADCQNPNYLYGYCGTEQAETCRSLLQTEYSTQFDASTASWDVVTVPASLGGSNDSFVYAKAPAYSYAGHYASGTYNTFLGNVERAQTTNLTKPWWYLDPRYFWIQDGPRSSSCEEYIFERYASYTRFENQALKLGEDWVGIYRLAFDATNPSSIAFKDIVGSDGVWTGTSPVSTTFGPKNAYFTPLQLDGPPGYVSSLSSYWEPIVRAGSATTRKDWAYHRDIGNQALAWYPVDQLDREYEEQRQYLANLADRARVMDEYRKDRAACDAKYGSTNPSCVAIGDAVGSQLVPIDFGIAVSLFNAQQRGCMNTSGLTPCDWSPRAFFDTIQENVGKQRNPRFQQCVELTKNDFSGGVIGLATTSGIPAAGISAQDWKANPTMLGLLFTKLEAYLRGLELPTDPATGRATVHVRKSDSGSLGNDMFGAGYSYEAGWGLDNITPQLCTGQVGAKGYFNANAKVLGYGLELVDALAYLQTETSTVDVNQTILRTHAHLRVLGTSLYDAGSTTDLHFNISAEPKASRDQQVGPTVYIPVLGIPVALKAGITGTVGLKAGLEGHVARDCTRDTLGFEVNGSLRPYAGIDAWASASVNAGIIEAGVKGRVTLVRLDLPMTMTVGTRFRDPYNTQTLSLYARTRLDLEMRQLDGKISLFGRLLWKTYEKDLVNWQAPVQRQNLFELNFDPMVELSLIQLRL